MEWYNPRGSLVAIITPFKDGNLDLEAFTHLINWHAGLGTAAIVVAGTTGEASTMDYDEQVGIVAVAVEIAGDRIPIIAGTGSNNTLEAIKLTQGAKLVGACAGLSITPYYNKPTQNGLVKHFSAVAESSDLPMILYNVTSRTGVTLSVESMVELATRHENIVGIKEADGNMARMSSIFQAFGPGSDFMVYSGDDFTNFTAMALGARGTISVVANVLPLMMSNMWHAGGHLGHWMKAREIHFNLMPMCTAMFLETNPGPAKAALALMEKCTPEIRLPMTPLSQGNMEVLTRTLRHYKLIGPAVYR